MAIGDVAPGIGHWAVRHEGIGQVVHSYWVRDSAALIDPMLPPEGLEPFREDPPRRILLSNRHHLRHAERWVEAFGASVHCHAAGLHEFAGARVPVEGFAFGDEVAPGIVAREVGVLTPEETALHVTAAPGALALADAVMRGRDGALGFVPDELLGDDADAIKAGLRDALRSLGELGFDALLLAHGEPRAPGGDEELAAFAGRG